MANDLELEVYPRATQGKAAARRMRRLEDLVPAVIYGAGEGNVNITMSQNKIRHALAKEDFHSSILTLHLNGQQEKVVLKNVQRHLAKPLVLHVDFLRVNMNRKFTISVPLHFEGADQAPGVKAGGLVSHLCTEVEISCLPADLPKFLRVDLSNLGIEQSLHLSDLVLPPGVEIPALASGETHDRAVVNIHHPRVEKEPEAVEAAATAEAKPAETAAKTEG